MTHPAAPHTRLRIWSSWRALAISLAFNLISLSLGPAVHSVGAQVAIPAVDELTFELWASDDRIVHGDTAADERLLREARFVLSGLLHGWRFEYTPADAARGVETRFVLEPVGLIPWGDERLSIRALRSEHDTVYGQFDVALDASDVGRRRAWEASSVARTSGSGRAPVLQGLPGKLAAMEEGIRVAIHAHLRATRASRPRDVRGYVLLEDAPRVRTLQGEYEARVRIRVSVDSVREYLVF